MTDTRTKLKGLQKTRKVTILLQGDPRLKGTDWTNLKSMPVGELTQEMIEEWGPPPEGSESIIILG